MNEILFYDTNALLSLQKKIFETEQKFYISSITLNELENIKTSGTKDEEVRYQARCLIRLLEDNEDKYEIILYKECLNEKLKEFDLPPSADCKIVISAYQLQKYLKEDAEIIFITKDLVCKQIAKSIGLKTSYVETKDKENYTGFKLIEMSDKELADFYINYADNKNPYNLLENEYIVIKSISENKIVDKYKWKDNKYHAIPFIKAESKMFGKVAPKNGDIYQQLALDSLENNQITMLRGAAGTGKSYLAFGHMFSLLEHGKIDKIIIFCNCVATKGSAKLGFYPGSRTEKLLDSQIGNLLESKIGDRVEVERLIADGKLVLLPFSDIRGYDTTGLNAAIYISEAQNLDIELMRLALQRIGEDSICIIDGDDQTQVDMSMYAGDNNGMKRASKVFRGHSCYGEVQLQNIYRSEIAKIAQLM